MTMHFKNKMSSNQSFISEKQLEHLLSTLSPTKIAALEKTLKSYQNKCQTEMINISSNKENDDDFEEDGISVKNEPVIVNMFSNNNKTKNRGLTYENGRRNLKSEPVTAEERERRAKRRERNRIAAQKCRERRQQQIEELQQQVDALRSTEQKLYSTLKELSDEENELRIKLSNHNCVISETNNGDLSFIVSSTFTPQYSQSMGRPTLEISSSTTQCRPSSLPVSSQNYNINLSLSSDNFISKDESLTPLLSPDSYNILKYHIKTEAIPTTMSQTMDSSSKRTDSSTKVAFSWSNSIIDHLSMPSLEPSSNSTYLTTPVVDLPFYSGDSYCHNDSQYEDMEWNSNL